MTETTETAEFDTTMALLASEIPNIDRTNVPAYVDSDEEEVFFGNVPTNKELYGKNARPGALPMRSTPIRRSETIPEESEDKENLTENVSSSDLRKNSNTKAQRLQRDKVTTPSTPKMSTDDESKTSFINIDDDQMFDCSLFTEYTDHELSIMSAKMSNKWRARLSKEETQKLKQASKKADKHMKEISQDNLNSTLTLLNEGQSLSKEVFELQENPGQVEEVPFCENSISENKSELNEEQHDELPAESEVVNEPRDELPPAEASYDDLEDKDVDANFQSSIVSTCSDWFNTTREEMILYEKFGEDYDIIVDRMSHDEKQKLKEEIANSVPKDVRELLGDEVLNVDRSVGETQLEKVAEEPDVLEPSASDNSSSTVCVEETPDVSSVSDRLDKPLLPEPPKPARTPVPLPRTLTPRKKCDDAKDVMSKTPEVIEALSKFDLNDGTNTTPAKHEGVRKFFKTPEQLRTPSYLKPTASSQQKCSPRNFNPSSPSTMRPATTSPFVQPCPPPKLNIRVRTPNIDMAEIVSPVAQYIHNSNVPSLIRKIRAKASDLDEELAALQKQDELERQIFKQSPEQPKKRYFRPLPEAQYRSSTVALEKEIPNKSVQALPKKFMVVPSTEAVVVRHLGRDRVAQEELQKLAESPDRTAVLVRSAPRESDVGFNTSTMEMSIREVKKIKKLTPCHPKPS